MRKIIITTAVLVLVSCGTTGQDELKDATTTSSDSSETTTTAEATTTTTEPPTTTTTTEPPTTTTTTEPRPAAYKVGDKVETESGGTVQFFSYQQPVPPPDEFSTPDPGMELALVDVEVCAGTEVAAYNTFGVQAQTADNRRYEQAMATAKEPTLSSGDLQPGALSTRAG